MLKLYAFSRVEAAARGNTRDLRILWALEEMQLPFELVGMDHPARELSTDAYRKLSPFEQIPAIDDDGTIVSESAAILIYLAKKTGTLIPGDLAGETEVIRWSFAALNSVEFPLLNLLFLDFAADPDPGAKRVRAQMVGIAHRMLTGLERWFDDREFVAADAFTVADILMAHVLAEIKDDRMLTAYPCVRRYRSHCLARTAWRRVLDRYFERVAAA